MPRVGGAPGWEVVATFLHRPPADVVWSVLDGHGIPAEVDGEDANRLAGVALGEVHVRVPSDRAEEALALLASLDDGLADGPDGG